MSICTKVNSDTWSFEVVYMFLHLKKLASCWMQPWQAFSWHMCIMQLEELLDA